MGLTPLPTVTAPPRPVPGQAGGRASLFPRPALVAAAFVVGMTLIAVATLRLRGYDPVQPPAAVSVERRLVFSDTAEGAVQVSDARSGEVLARMAGEQGFLRGVLRGLARERRALGVPADRPYVLSLHADSRLLITDPATGQRIDLASFGPDNAAVFLRWLPVSPR
ncbi:MAG: photosynthetic complex assembly protein PuhC [Rubrivivax sp.]